MLSQTYPADVVATLLLPREKWQPFPKPADRAAWDALPDDLKRAQIERGEKHLNFQWPSLPATLLLEFARNGNRSNYETPHFARRSALVSLVIAECIENRGRFLDDILNGVWAICEESTWIWPAHIGAQKAGTGLPDTAEPIVDLGVGESAAMMAWIHYLLAEKLDTISPLIAQRIEREVRTRFLTPNLQREDFWWMGLSSARQRRVNNWNPWVISNWIAAAMLLESDADARAAHVAKAMRCVDQFIDTYPADGGCDEGPGYWGRAGASLFDCLDVLHSVSAGRINVFDRPLIRNMASFIYRTQISDRYFINFADAPALFTPEAGLTYAFGKAVDDPQMMALGRWIAREYSPIQTGLAGSMLRVLRSAFLSREFHEGDAQPPLQRDTWLPDIQVMAARDKASTADGFFLGAKGGHNAESHNHNDVGQFIVYLDGKPVLIDAGVETYSRKTFSAERYTIWTMRSNHHNLPTIGTAEQKPGPEFAARDVAYQADDKTAQLTLDIAGAYDADAGLKRWTRTAKLTRGEAIDVHDDYALERDVPQITLSLLTPCAVNQIGPNRLRLERAKLDDTRDTGEATITFEPDMAVTLDPVELTDAKMRKQWGEHLTRIILRLNNPGREGSMSLRLTR